MDAKISKISRAQTELLPRGALSGLSGYPEGGTLVWFMSRAQRGVLAEMLRGEEREFFADKIIEYADRINSMPETYGQDGKGQDAIVYLHYFGGSVDLWITEKDMGAMRGGDKDVEQIQAFGIANLYGTGIKEGELGYINIQEAIDSGLELDLHWEPKAIKDIK